MQLEQRAKVSALVVQVVPQIADRSTRGFEFLAQLSGGGGKKDSTVVSVGDDKEQATEDSLRVGFPSSIYFFFFFCSLRLAL